MTIKTSDIKEKSNKIEAKIVESEKTKESKEIETKTESKESKKGTLTIKLLWFGCFILLVIVCAVLLYLRYSLIKDNNKQNIVNAQPVNISCSNTILDVGETLEIEIANSKANTVLLTDKPEIIEIEGNKITALRRGRSCNICYYWTRKKQ